MNTRVSARGVKVWRWIGRGFVLVVAGTWLACGVDGERAMTGMCPEGETCSSETPEGLRFTGVGTSDLPFASTLPTAVGGAQRFHVAPAGWSDESMPPFEAHSGDPSVFTIESVDSPASGWPAASGYVSVRGTGAGSAQLRIVDEAGALLDRTPLAVAEVHRVELRAASSLFAGWRGDWAFRRGGSGRVVFALYSAGGQRLIDESAQPVAAAGVEPSAWDAAEVIFDQEGDTLTLAIDLGAGRREASAPLVDGIDRIERVSPDSDAPLERPSIPVGSEYPLCFIAMYGELAVAGVTFEVSTQGPIALRSGGDDAGPAPDACIWVEATEVGDATVVVRAEGVELRQPVRVEP